MKGSRRAIREREELRDVSGAHNSQAAAVEQVRVNLSGTDIGMPEEFLDCADIVASLEKLGRKTVAKGVGGSVFRDSCSLDCFLNCF